MTTTDVFARPNKFADGDLVTVKNFGRGVEVYGLVAKIVAVDPSFAIVKYKIEFLKTERQLVKWEWEIEEFKPVND